MICDFGEIVVVPFPFVDRPIQKRRPAVVFSSRVFNEENGHSILLMITTGAGSRWPSDIPLDALAETGLTHRSVIRWKAFTLPNASILRRVGNLGDRERSALGKAAGKLLAA